MSTFTTTPSGRSPSAGNGTYSGDAAVTEWHSFTFNVIFPGKWPKRPIALLGAFIRHSKQLNETKAKARGNLITLQLFRRHSMCSRILLCTFILSYVVFFPDDETWQHLSAVIGRCTAGHAHIFHSFLTTYAILIKFIGGVTN